MGKKRKETKTVEERIRAAQQAAGEGEAWDHGTPSVMQQLIDSGQAWRLEGSCGRTAMRALESGACFLPEVPYRDYYGNVVPARSMVKSGTKGTLENAARFWGVKV